VLVFQSFIWKLPRLPTGTNKVTWTWNKVIPIENNKKSKPGVPFACRIGACRSHLTHYYLIFWKAINIYGKDKTWTPCWLRIWFFFYCPQITWKDQNQLRRDLTHQYCVCSWCLICCSLFLCTKELHCCPAAIQTSHTTQGWTSFDMSMHTVVYFKSIYTTHNNLLP